MKNNTSEYIYPNKLPNYVIDNDKYTIAYVIANTETKPIWSIKFVYKMYLKHIL